MQERVDNSGLIAGITAYFIWGVFPVYFKLTEQIAATEILIHRIIWSVPFGLLILIFRKQLREVWTALKDPKKVLLLFIASVALALNWGVYIWAIQQDQIFQGSLGYYINPLMYVLVGVIFFKERLTRWQLVALAMAAIGVLILTFYGGQFPAISLILAVSFTIYGVMRKYVDIGAMPGLFIEVILLLLPALAYIYWLSSQGEFDFPAASLDMKTLLLLAGPITVLPLMAFAYAARRLTLTMLGFLQYIGPTLQFACGLYYGEAFTSAHGWCFGFIWGAVILFTWDTFRQQRNLAKT